MKHTPMNPSDARAYVTRWNTVAKVEAEEFQRLSLEDRWLQMLTCYRLGHSLGLTSARENDPQEAEAAHRWERLKERYRS